MTRLRVGRRDQLGLLRGGRSEQDANARGMVDQEAVDVLGFADLELCGQVGDRLVLRVQVQQDADVAELERPRP